MNRHVNAIAGRLSPRPPQRISLEILHRITEIAPPAKDADVGAQLAAIQNEFSSVTDFEREFPSLCFALATGVGKTRLMGAFISYLHLAHGFSNFFVLAPNLTIYNKLITDFTPNTTKYVFKGVAEFDVNSPTVITGDTYESGVGVREEGRRQATMFPELDGVHVNIFNISKINSEVRGGKAMSDGFVKEPAVVTRKNFNPAGMSAEEIERMKLEDGVRLHESVKVELETYARESNNPIVKPFLLVIARDTTHAGQLIGLVQSDAFFEGAYRDKVIQVDSSRTGKDEEEMIERLLKVEHTDEPTEIVIHVNMLKEGWDVTNLYTIVPLRAANARILIEQSIGCGLRLPFGRRTGVMAVDRLNIVAHDKFQEIIDEANRPDSAIKMQAVMLDETELNRKTATMVSQPTLAAKLGLKPNRLTGSTQLAGQDQQPVFTKPEEQKVAQAVWDEIRKLENQPQKLASVTQLQRPEIQAAIVKAVEEQQQPVQLELEGFTEKADIADVVARTVQVVTQQTIDIPRILVIPKGEVKTGFSPFTLKLESLRYPPVSDELWIQHLRTSEYEVVSLSRGGIEEARLEDYIVSGLVDFDDISYDDHADLLYGLAGQAVQHFNGYLSEDEARKVLRCYQRDIARFIHAQVQDHYWEDTMGYKVKVSKGFTELKESAYSYSVAEPPATIAYPLLTRATWPSTCSAGLNAVYTRFRNSTLRRNESLP
jgi:superfamily II DNA or RNA helicase